MKSNPRRPRRTWTVADVSRTMDRLASTALAQPWDNVGLLAGDPAAPARRVLLCIDLTANVAAEAVRLRAGLVLAYHPPIFKPIQRLVADSGGTDAAVLKCLHAGIAIYATHTALDATPGGTNDVLAELCGLTDVGPMEWVSSPGGSAFKLVTFVPREALESVAEAMFDAGAGRIGEYTRCSFRLEGEGTFFGSEQTHPRVGKRSRLERVPEARIEVVVPQGCLADVVAALRGAHPYEEPAFDLYPLQSPPTGGIGRIGRFVRPVSVGALARTLVSRTRSETVQIVGRAADRVQRGIVVAGAAGDLPFPHLHGKGDVVVTGEMRHHDALSVIRRGASAILLGHWASERPVLKPLARRLTALLPGLTAVVSTTDAAPIAGI